jgi:hypothetical protein
MSGEPSRSGSDDLQLDWRLRAKGWRGFATSTQAASYLLVLALPLAIAAPALAETVDTSGATKCEIVGFSTDRDPDGTNIRSAPRANSSVIGHLASLQYPGNDPSAGTLVGQAFRIIGSKNGWLLIADVEPFEDRQGRPVNGFVGPGWVSGALVGVQLGAQTLRAAPRHDAAVLARLVGENWGPDSAAVTVVHGCEDKYVEVTATPLGGKPLRGWSWFPCASQLTTCDRSNSDLDN